MGNVKFHYLYRDGSNYRKWGEVVFFDADDLPLGLITKRLQKLFLEDGLFIAHQVRIPEVFLAAEDHLTSDDHCFHEFSSVESTSECPNDLYGRSIRAFMTEVAAEAKHGWHAFDPQDRLPQHG